ncbi:sialate O-acetylesterase [Coraliomargarita akajimensis]|uniref:Sialate O-acetylesterase n=1 Tax=Coraliomargarita akajimensis (strain DSM 45221 / IAM 15411 / JCM 23193 / KCTC 12865 / 04OKA010-24) TaxID=583355 RepID=D5ER35_CORAD|nr:sialate O-acetylesterase [Coraliomargarita akajimensis]ADE54028.1 Sialate O-acetylesterase [Coraliomargarita akajimensis DSM 45221]
MRLLPIPLLFAAFTAVHAETKLASIFTESMVLQQQDQALIWGTDEPGQPIKVTGSWGEDAHATTDDHGKWRLRIATPAAGGPYTLTTEGSSTVAFKDVLIGEVWLCSGQSNMQMALKGYPNEPIIGSQETILHSAKDTIRVFGVHLKDSQTPLDSVNGHWFASNPHNTPNFSATAYFFAKQLQASLDVPIGLIVTSWGGSSAEAWTDAPTLEALGTELEPLQKLNTQQRPSVLYNAMIHPLIGYTIKGAIWYQGESNVSRADKYRELITAMVTAWREQWDQGDFPFYYVQIAPFHYGNLNSAYLRESQLQTMQTLPNSGMAVTLDIGDQYCIHPSEKKTVGDRLANWALGKTYEIPNIETTGPLYESHQLIDGGKVSLQFSNAPMGVSSFGKALTGFAVAGEDRIYHPAQASIGRSVGQVIVWSDQVTNPVAVRYAFENLPEASLFSVSGLPASSFRTDNW